MNNERLIPSQKAESQTAHLAAMVDAVTNAGVPASEAAGLAKQFLGMLGADCEKYALLRARNPKGKHDPILIVPHPVNRGQFVMEYFAPASTVAELWQKIRDARHRGVIIFDFNEVYVDFCERLADLALAEQQ